MTNCVGYVVIMVELVVTCYCYDCLGHGEIYGGLGCLWPNGGWLW